MSGLKALRLDATPDAQQRLLGFLSLLQKWNATYSLTSIRSAADMLTVHLLDSLSIVSLLDRLGGGTLLDVGSGAGLPGIPLSLVRPTLRVHSVDAVAKKIGFQLQAKAALRLVDFHPHHARIEDFAMPEVPSIVVSRAFSGIAKMLASIDHLADGTTSVVAMKGQFPAAELDALPEGWMVETIDRLEVPFLGARRCAVVLKRTHGS